MWHEDSEATNASSGSTASGLESGTGTTLGELEAGTMLPPSKRHSCAREYLLSLNAAPVGRSQTTIAECVLILALPVVKKRREPSTRHTIVQAQLRHHE